MRVSLLTTLASFLFVCPFAPVEAADPCQIALLALAGEDREDRAIRRLQEKAKAAKDPAPYLERLGWAFVTKARVANDPGFYLLAERCARCIESIEPRRSEALLLGSHVLNNLHRFRDAEALARTLVRERGLWFDYGVLGDALMEQGKLDEAAAAYQRMMDEKPGPEAYSRAAHLRWLKGDLYGAIELMRMSARATGPQQPESAAWAYVRLALYEMQAGRFEKTAALTDAALAFQPEYAPALLARGRLRLARGEYEEAIGPLERAVQLNPLPEYRWALVEALAAAGRRHEAAQVEAELLETGSVDDPRTLALYLATTGTDGEAALRLAQRELAERGDVVTLDAMAWSCRAAGELRQARAYSERALREGTQDARLFYHAGVIAAESGQQAAAGHWFERAVEIRQMLLPSEERELRRHVAALKRCNPMPGSVSRSSHTSL